MDNIWIWLVVSNPLKNMKVNWDDDIPNSNGKIKVMFQSPPTSKWVFNIYVELPGDLRGMLDDVRFIGAVLSPPLKGFRMTL